MTFLSLVARGLMRRPLRTGLTIAGISLGIAAVVALVGMSRGFEKSWETGLIARGTDIVVSNMGGALTPKPFGSAIRDRIEKLPGVAATCNILVELTSIESSELMILSAREWGGFSWQHLKIFDGRMPHSADERAVVLGRTAADVLQKKVGDPIQVETEELQVVGIVEGGALVEDGSVILSLPLLQEILASPDKINVIDVKVTPEMSEKEMRTLCDRIDDLAPEVRALPVSEHFRDSQGFRMIRAMSWGTSMLAVLIGILGIMNTMLMTVFERTQEICILLAIGWKRGRILRMILYESALLGFAGGIVGVVLGAIGVKILGAAPTIRGMLEPDLGAPLLISATIAAIAIGALSGLYPAWRSSRLAPSQALQGS